MRALERGLTVLQILQGASEPQSLHDLFLRTGISKPSLLRVIATLEAYKLVRRGIEDGLYHSVVKFDYVRSSGSRHERLVAVAAPILDRLCLKTKWPIDLVVRAGNFMRLCESTRVLSPFQFNRIPIGQRIDFVFSAAGRAYLAFAPEAEVEIILDRLSQSREILVRNYVRSGQVFKAMDETRRRGFGERDNNLMLLPGINHLVLDGTWGISVPLLGRRRVFGCLNLIWVHRAGSTSTMVRRHLGDLQAAAREIVEVLETRATQG